MTEDLSVQKLKRRMPVPSRKRRRVFNYRFRVSAIPSVVHQYPAPAALPDEVHGYHQMGTKCPAY